MLVGHPRPVGTTADAMCCLWKAPRALGTNVTGLLSPLGRILGHVAELLVKVDGPCKHVANNSVS